MGKWWRENGKICRPKRAIEQRRVAVRFEGIMHFWVDGTLAPQEAREDAIRQARQTDRAQVLHVIEAKET